MSSREQQQIFESWLKEYRGLFFKVIRVYAFNSEDREDLFQEVAVQVWKSVPNFKNESAVSTWIYKVALYTAMAWAKREVKHRDNTEPLPAQAYLLTETQVAAEERLNWLYEQIAQLNEIDRSLTLLLLDGYSYREMAGILGISETNVGVKINRIKKHLTQRSQKNIDDGI